MPLLRYGIPAIRIAGATMRGYGMAIILSCLKEKGL